jgi:hypothetical protein
VHHERSCEASEYDITIGVGCPMMRKGSHDIADIPVAAAIMGPLPGTQAIGKGRLDYSRYSHTTANPDAFLGSPPCRRKAGDDFAADSDLAAALIRETGHNVTNSNRKKAKITTQCYC